MVTRLLMLAALSSLEPAHGAAPVETEKLHLMAAQVARATLALESEIAVPPPGKAVSPVKVTGGAVVLVRGQHLAVVTAYRAVAGAEKITLRRWDGLTTAAQVGGVDARLGLVTLRVEDGRFLAAVPPLPLSPLNWSGPAQRVYAAGETSLLGQRVRLVWGTHRGFAQGALGFYVRPGLVAEPGMPLLDDEGALTALGYGTQEHGGVGEYLAIPAAHIQRFLESSLTWPAPETSDP